MKVSLLCSPIDYKCNMAKQYFFIYECIFLVQFGEAVMLEKKWNWLAVLSSNAEVKKCRKEIALSILKHSGM